MRKLIARFLAWLLEEIEPQIFSLDFIFPCGTATHKAKHMNTTITDNGSVILIATCTSAAGNPVTGAAISWGSSDETVAVVTAGADGATATVHATGKLGTATITAAAGNLTATDEVTVVAGQVANLQLSEAPAA